MVVLAFILWLFLFSEHDPWMKTVCDLVSKVRKDPLSITSSTSPTT